MTITEKVAYLRGLSEGLGIEENGKEGKVIKAIIDTLDDIAFSVADLEDGFGELCDQIDLIDEDLETLEEDYYSEIDDEDDDADEDDFDDELYEVECPACGDTICIDEDILDEGEIECPNCGELLEFDFEFEEGDCDCGDCGCKETEEK